MESEGVNTVGKTLYLECESGISGDMAVAALLDLGASEQVLRAALASLPISGFEVRVSRVNKAGLDACDFAVVLDGAHENHDHDMAYLHGHDQAVSGGGEGLRASGHGHSHDCGHVRHHADGSGSYAREREREREHGYHHADGGHHHHEHRGMPEIEAIINAAAISSRAKELALRIFGVIARAEAKAHGVPYGQVHFHEVGAVDSIVDVVAAAVCLDNLGIEDVVVPRLCEGRGTVRCQHGILPVPVPAVSNIVAEAGIPLSIVNVHGELVTPTGAAIAAAVRTRATLPESFAIAKVGVGAGKRAYERPSLVRAMLIEETAPALSAGGCAEAGGKSGADFAGAPTGGFSAPEPSAGIGGTALASVLSSSSSLAHAPNGENVAAAGGCALTPHGGPYVWKLETEVDDCPGEALGFALERLLAAGAREAHYAPVFMKKNRPGHQIQVLCGEEDIAAMESILFEETTTIGIRRTPMERTPLERQAIEVETEFGPALAKRVMLPNGTVRAYPEYESVAAICRERGVAYQEAYRAVLAAL